MIQKKMNTGENLMKKYDIYLVEFAYEGGSGSKWRPALILDGSIIRLSKITSNTDRTETPYCTLKDWRLEGLHKPSIVRITQTIDVDSHSLGRYVGHLTARDIAAVELCLSHSDILEESDFKILNRFI